MIALPLREKKAGSANRNVTEPVLRVEGLEVTYYTDLGRAKALDDVSFTLNSGEKLGMVGESGSGKSTMALAMMRMIKPPGRIEGGKVIVGGTDLMALDEERHAQGASQQDRLYPAGRDELAQPGDADRRADGRRHQVAPQGREPKSSIEDRFAKALQSVDLDPGVFRMYAA